MTVTGSLLLFPAYGLARASLVAPLEGLGLAALALYASCVLRERLKPRHLLALGAILAGLALTGLAGTSPRAAGEAFRPQGLALLTGLLLVLAGGGAGLVLVRRRRRAPALPARLWGLVLGGAAGSCAGVAMILQKVVGGQLLQAGAPATGLSGDLGLFLGVAALGFVLQQAAWLHGTAVEVVASYSSLAILVPAGSAGLVFGEPSTWPLRVGLALVLLGVVLLAGQAALGRGVSAGGAQGALDGSG